MTSSLFRVFDSIHRTQSRTGNVRISALANAELSILLVGHVQEKNDRCDGLESNSVNVNRSCCSLTSQLINRIVIITGRPGSIAESNVISFGLSLRFHC